MMIEVPEASPFTPSTMLIALAIPPIATAVNKSDGSQNDKSQSAPGKSTWVIW
jgi:hypothetical protein